MEPAFFFSDARRISFDLKDAYLFDWRPEDVGDLRLVQSSSVRDEHGDTYTRLEMAFPSSGGIPFKKFRYRHAAGDTGFDSFTSNEQGVKPDREAHHLVERLLDDAWTCDPTKRSLQCFRDVRSKIDHPLEFFSRKPKNAPMISFHYETMRGKTSPVAEQDISKIYSAHGAERFEAVLRVVDQCKMVMIWQASYGTNPTIMSTKMKVVLEEIAKACRNLKINLVGVETEAQLPEW